MRFQHETENTKITEKMLDLEQSIYRISKGVAPEIALEEGRTAGMGLGLEMEQKVKAVLQK